VIGYSPVVEVAEAFCKAGAITTGELERIKRQDAAAGIEWSRRLALSNREAGARYDALPWWRKAVACWNRSWWVARHRDYWPL